ncbi:hypothetical protein [Actinokineospora sp. NPDC004072]
MTDLGSGARRYLIATAVTRYPKAPELDRPELLEARRRIVDLFTTVLGYQHVTDIGMDPSRDQLIGLVNSFCRSGERHPDDLVVVYLAAHGDVLDDAGFEHQLLMADSEPDNPVFALPSADLARAMLLRTRVRRVMLLLDTCYSGRGGQDMIAAAVSKFAQRWGAVDGAGFVVVASAQPHEQAYAEAFPELLHEAVQALSVAGYGPDVLDIGAVVERMNRNPRRPPDQRIGWNSVGLSGFVPAFLPNPRHDARLNGADLRVQQLAEWEARAEQREVEYRQRFLTKAMAHHGVDGEWWFAGRHKALAAMTTWLSTPGANRRVLVVSGGPGSGKTAVLGLVATLAHPDRRQMVPTTTLRLDHSTIPPVGSVDLEIHATGLTADEVRSRIAAVVGTTATSTDEFITALAERGRPWTILVDALDEAADPRQLIAFLTRLVRVDDSGGAIRLLLGMRTHLATLIPAELSTAIDLDGAFADPSAVRAYVIRGLLGASQDSPYRAADQAQVAAIADEVAAAAGTSFLIAHLSSHTLANMAGVPNPDDARWRSRLPRMVGDAMNQDLDRLGEHSQRARDLLLPLAYAQGQGLPWEDIWAAAASAISGRRYTDEDLFWLRDAAGSHVVEVVEGGRSVYRLYHRAMAEHLADRRDDAQAHQALVQVLTARAPRTDTGAIDWAHAHPYSLRNLATHAAGADQLDRLVADGDFLVHAAPDTLLLALRAVRSTDAQLTAAVYRASAHLHRGADPGSRRQLLALDAARLNARPQLAAVRSGLVWQPRWSTSSQITTALLGNVAGRARVDAVACGTLDGQPIAITGGHALDVWDLPTGQKITRLDNSSGTTSIACTEVLGRPVAVTTSARGTVDVWDLRSGRHVRGLDGHTARVWSVACTQIAGRPIAITGSTDRTVRVWDLTSGRCLAVLNGHNRTVRSVACVSTGYRTLLVSVGWEGRGLLWDLSLAHDSRAVGVLTGHLSRVTAVACTLVDGKPVAVTGSCDRTVRVWDLSEDADRRRPMFTLRGHSHRVWAVACTSVGEIPVAVTGGTDRSVRLWDVRTGRSLGLLSGHANRVTSVACAEIEGNPVAVTANSDCTTRIWDIGTAGRKLDTAEIWAVARAVVAGRPVAVTGGVDNAVRLWDVADLRCTAVLSGHTDKVTAVATAEVSGRPIAISGSGDRTLRVWDLISRECTTRIENSARIWAIATITCAGRAVAVSGDDDGVVKVLDLVSGRSTILGRRPSPVWAVATTDLDGRPVAITAGDEHLIVVWDLETGAVVREFPCGQGRVWAMACAEDGPPVVLSAHDSGWVQVWNLRTGACEAELRGDGAVHAVDCLVVDGRPVVVAAGADRVVRVWDLRTTRCTALLEGHKDVVWALGWAEVDDRPVVISAGDDRGLRVWDLGRGPTGAHADQVTALACMVVDGVRVAVSGSADHTVRLWDLATGHTLGVHRSRDSAITSVTTSAINGRPVLVVGTANRTVTLVEPTPRMTPLRTVGDAIHTGELTALACTTLGGRPVAVLAGLGMAPRLWRLPDGPLRALSPEKLSVTAAACATVGGRTVCVLGTTDGGLRLWDLAARAPAASVAWPGPDTSPVVALDCLDADRRPIAVTGHASGAVRVWDLGTGVVLATLTGHTSRVNTAACLMRDGSPIAVTGGDHTVRFWNLATMSAEAVYSFHDYVRAVAATPAGSVIVGSGHEVSVLEPS